MASARAEAGASVAELDAIRAIGESLRLAVDLAAQSKGRDTIGLRAALQRADEAIVQLSLYVGDQGVSGLLAAAEGRLLATRRGR